jgi:aspartate/methionine/tyrosine aminotransferase
MSMPEAQTALRYRAPYLEWAKTRPSPEYDLAASNILACSLDELTGAVAAIELTGANDNGYAPLMDAIAARYGTPSSHVTTAGGTSGANFLVCAALLESGDDVLVERPGYDPLLGAARMFGARTVRFERRFEDGFALDPERVREALTPRTKLIVVTHPHNPTGVAAGSAALDEIARIAERAGAHVLVDEVYRDVTDAGGPPLASRNDIFITTSSLTKSYGLSGLRSGWVIASEALTYRLRRARDIVDGTGSIVAERLATLAFEQLPRLADRGRTLFVRNKALVREFLESRSDLEWVAPDGSVVFPRIRGVADTTAFADRLMRERKTAVVPGIYFEAPSHFRIGFGGETDKLRGGLERLGAALDERARVR